LTMDLHADQIQGFFDIPVDNVYATPILLGDLWKHGYKNLVVVSPDVGGVVRARAIAKRLESDLVIIDKRRPRPNVATVMNIIGDVNGRTCVIMDDMVDTANTLCAAARALKEQGAVRVVAYCTHPVLSGKAIENISASVIDELVVTDTIPLRPDAVACGKIRVVSVATMAGMDANASASISAGTPAGQLSSSSLFSMESSGAASACAGTRTDTDARSVPGPRGTLAWHCRCITGPREPRDPRHACHDRHAVRRTRSLGTVRGDRVVVYVVPRGAGLAPGPEWAAGLARRSRVR